MNGAPSCTAGTLASGTDGLYLGALNMFRAFAGLSSVSVDSTQDANSQQCALMCQANNKIQHSWPTSANCYTTAGNVSCGSSNLLGGSGTITPADAIADWVNDMNNVDNPNNLGHRLWCLSPTLGGVSMGITTNFASLYVFGTQSAPAPGRISNSVNLIPNSKQSLSLCCLASSGGYSPCCDRKWFQLAKLPLPLRQL